MKGAALISLLVVLAMVPFMAWQSEAIDCGQVSGALGPCVPYLTGSGGSKPSGSCCSGVQDLNNKLKTREDRQAACDCVKSAASRFPNLKPDAASNLPGQCGISFSVPISASTNCRNIP